VTDRPPKEFDIGKMAVTQLAEDLHYWLNRYDPTDEPEWTNLTEHQKEIYCAALRQVLCRSDLIPTALAWVQSEFLPAHRQAIMNHSDRPSFLSVVEELELLMRKDGVPSDNLDGFLKMFYNIDKCLIVEPRITSDDSYLLEPSDLMMRYVSAVRASDWPLASVIEYEIRSL
jgi:hypothetical protein